MLNYFLLGSFLLLQTLIFAANTVIKGFAKDFNDSELSVYVYEDFITERKKKIGFTQLINDNAFTFKLDQQHIQKVELAIEDKTTWFFIEPGKVYNITLSYDPELNKKRIYDRVLSLKFNFPAPNELNQLVAKFNRKYDDFITQNEALFIKRDGSVTPKIEEFENNITKEFQTYQHEFINNFIKYTLATTFNAIDVSYYKGDKKALDKADIFMKYLQNQPVLYHNPEYMHFFKDFFKGEIKKLTLQLHGMDITKAINEQNSYDNLVKALAKYPFLENRELLQLFMINGLREIGKDKYFEQDNIVSILQYITDNSAFPEQKIIANNVIQKITYQKLAKGSKAPNFTLPTVKNTMVSLGDFEGKYVYVNFWASWSIPALKEMKIIEKLYQKYKNKVAFVSICTDNDKDKIKELLKENPGYTWTFLQNKDRELMQAYEVRTLPTYILIDQQGNILRFPAPRPGGNIERPTEEDIERLLYELK